ncbi:MAG: HEAT repeat domain-containing protein, partial [Myxococcota bacterium]
GVEAGELEGFIRALVTSPDAIQAAGGIEKFLFERGIKKISVNELNYQDLLYGELPEDPPEEFFAVEEEPGEGGVPEEDPLALPAEAPPLLEQLIKQLVALDGAREPRAYGENAAALVSLVNTAEPPFESEDLYRALRVLSGHAAGREGLDASIVPHALWAIREIASPKAIDFLIERLMAPRSATAPRVLDLLSQIGSGAIPQLIDHLAAAKSIRARRILSTAISSFGDAAVPHLLNALNDQRWFVIRNTVTILGEIGNPETISSLEPLASNPDRRIAKEALRALGQIRSPESRKILERFLVHARGELQLLAAFALGVLRDPGAVPTLCAMLPRRVIFTRFEIQREVIKALAKIGSPAAVPTLGRLLRRRSVLARERNEVLRTVAAQALARLNTEEARVLLMAGIGKGNRTVDEICQSAIEAQASR